MTNTTARRLRRVCPAVLGAALCAAGPVAPAAQASAYPLTIRNCGQTTTYKKAPSRVVSLDGISTEVLLHLGLQNRMVGTAFRIDPIFDGGGGFPSLAKAYKSVPVLAAKYPSREVLLNASPDFVTGNADDYTFGPTTNGGSGFTRAELAKKKINTYTFQCHDEKQSNGLLLRRYAEFGRIFGVKARADRLVASVRRILASTANALRGQPRTRTFYYETGRGPLTTFGGGGGFDAGLQLAGGRNVFADLPSFPTPTVSAEAVITRNPDAILVVDQGTLEKSSATDKKKFLVSTLGTSVNAVKHNRFCFMTFGGFTTAVRTALTLKSLVPCLHPKLKLK